MTDTPTRRLPTLGTVPSAPVIATGLIVLAGSPLGLLWAAMSPHVELAAVLARPEATLAKQFAIDVRYLVITAVAGVLIGLAAASLLHLLRRVGLVPWILGALAAGGVLSALVAARVGERVRLPHSIPAPLANASPDVRKSVLDLIRFRIHDYDLLMVLPAFGIVAFVAAIYVSTRTQGVTQRVH